MLLLLPSERKSNIESAMETITAKKTVISPNFVAWKLISRNCAETVPFHKISIPGN